jgi:hypothetical protein
LFGASTSVGRCSCSTTFPTVNVLPEPVTPSSVLAGAPPSIQRHSCSIASG